MDRAKTDSSPKVIVQTPGPESIRITRTRKADLVDQSRTIAPGETAIIYIDQHWVNFKVERELEICDDLPSPSELWHGGGTRISSVPSKQL